MQVTDDELLTPEEQLARIEAYFKEAFALELQQLHESGLKPVVHVFTHLKWTITLLEAQLAADADLAFFPGQWYTEAQLADVALPTVQKKLAARLATN